MPRKARRPRLRPQIRGFTRRHFRFRFRGKSRRAGRDAVEVEFTYTAQSALVHAPEQQSVAAAHEAGIKALNTEAVQLPNAENGETAVVKAVIETGRGSFCALGDASPRNVEAEFVPHLIRVAETRAKARALRDALNIGVVAFVHGTGRRVHSFPTSSGSRRLPQPPGAPEKTPGHTAPQATQWPSSVRFQSVIS